MNCLSVCLSPVFVLHIKGQGPGLVDVLWAAKECSEERCYTEMLQYLDLEEIARSLRMPTGDA